MKKPELLVPGGDLEKLQTALNYGADAVYVGGERFGLRAHAGNFSLPALQRARDLTRQAGRRLYLTLNAFLQPEDLSPFADYLQALRPLDIDAYIVTDPGALALVRRLDPEREIHLSTQASTTNPAAIGFWQAAGVRRFNLARELSLPQVQAVAAATDADLEVFVHGAMCVAWSGRCLLSAAFTSRSANQGACAHPCRWRYALVEETRPGEYLPLEQDETGSYLFNSRDLCLIEYLPEILAAGVTGLKIEGRMKSCYYVAAVTRVYRAALDRWLADPQGWKCDPAWLEELDRVSHRPYGTGFLLGRDRAQVHPLDSSYRRTHTFVGIVEGMVSAGRGIVGGRNRFRSGETLQLIGPEMRESVFRVGEIRSADSGESLPAGQPNARVLLELPAGARAGDFLRREEKEC